MHACSCDILIMKVLLYIYMQLKVEICFVKSVLFQCRFKYSVGSYAIVISDMYM